ncbi:hypothetical protein CYMTET_18062 [Cymbomonas tetramitiformis]|uniref:Uncharacterized protein n=1 Tax=Cymbomonas tetramitiformis TaxID=36881 RepID=A0AAE0G8V1_9CHLO|nr:hypothetical protein CYMTET_18062 [Cymbomonas tetramitiformis]
MASRVQKLFCAGALTVLTSAGGILMELSKGEDGKYAYNSATVPLLAEALKLAISSSLLFTEHSRTGEAPQVTRDTRTVIKYIIPSIIYLICNNLTLDVLRYLPPSTYQILSNLRIVTTGLLSWLFLRRPLSRLQWIALVLVSAGAVSSQLGSNNDGAMKASLKGYFLMLLLCFLAALGGVVTEALMKGNRDSIHWQNTQLYTFGLVFNVFRLTADNLSTGFQDGFWINTLLNGYTGATYVVVANLALSGLLVSFIMKYVDVIAKNFATSLSMFLTPVVALILFGHQLEMSLLVGAMIAAISIFLFYAKPGDLFLREQLQAIAVP